MTDKTKEEYWNMNKEINREMRKHKREKKTEDIRNVIEEDRSLKVLRRRSAIGNKTIHRVKNKEGKIITNIIDIIKTIETFYKELYSSQDAKANANIPKVLNQWV